VSQIYEVSCMELDVMAAEAHSAYRDHACTPPLGGPPGAEQRTRGNGPAASSRREVGGIVADTLASDLSVANIVALEKNFCVHRAGRAGRGRWVIVISD
jgi:hypothetical protein